MCAFVCVCVCVRVRVRVRCGVSVGFVCGVRAEVVSSRVLIFVCAACVLVWVRVVV